jgi:hypothetical protein
MDIVANFVDDIDPNPEHTSDTEKSTTANKWCDKFTYLVGRTVCDPTDYEIDLTWVQRFELEVSGTSITARPVETYG